MGKWVTIRGAHVYIENDGTISKGPKALKEKNNKSNSKNYIKTTQKALENGKHPYVLELAKFINDRNDDLTDEEFSALYNALEVLRKRNK